MNWQNELWTFAYQVSWIEVPLAVLALVMSLVTFVKMVMNHPMNLLTLSRVIICAALFASFAELFNSGWEKPLKWMFIIGNSLAGFLIITNWCERKDKIAYLLSWFKPAPYPDKREDLM